MIRLTQIDETNRSQHYHLTEDDKCLFLYEYTAGANFRASDTNQLIHNLKKKPSTANHYEKAYKQKAITSCAIALSGALNEAWLQSATLIPVPGSKILGHPDYDNRIEKICRIIQPALNVDVRLLVQQTESYEPSHLNARRVTVQELLNLYRIDEDLSHPAPTDIGIVDDVLTAGTHFRAMHTILRARYPNARITGIFIARRVIANPFEDDVFA